MGTKRQELDNDKSCFRKAAMDEPLFVLRAQDKLAPNLVRHWARIAKAEGAPAAKISEALDLAAQMEAWPTRKMPD